MNRKFQRKPVQSFCTNLPGQLLLTFLFLIFNFDLSAQSTVIPKRYWTFNQTNALLDSTNNGNLNFSYYGCQYAIANAGVSKCLSLGTNGNIVLGGPFSADSAIVIEFLFKPGVNFNATKFFARSDNSIVIGMSYPYLNFNTSHKSFAGATVSDNFTVTLDGINRKNYGYYVDGNWHHMVFKFLANKGIKEIWVDGVKSNGFSKTMTAGYITNPLNNTDIYVNSGVVWERYWGYLDEVAFYNVDVPQALIYKHYLNSVTNSLPYSYTNDYSGSLPNAPSVSAAIDINEYAPGHPTPTVSALTQLQSAPMPRYLPSNTLQKNFNWIEPGYFGSFVQPGVSYNQAVTNSVNLQKELVFNYNYSWIVMSNTSSYQNLSNSASFESNWINTANQYPQYPASCISFWAQLHPSQAGYYSGYPYISSQNNPASHYLRNSSGQFLNPNGQVSSTKYWSPAAPHDSIIRDGLTQKFYLQQLLNKMTRPLNLINENGEVLPYFSQSILNMDPAVVTDKNSSGLD